MLAGQAQKEFFVNQAFALIDALLQQSVIASISAPPTDPDNGGVYRVTAPATAAWTGKEDSLAVRIAGAWHFAHPRDGMRIFDQGTGQLLVFKTQWRIGDAPILPTGGTVIDIEARNALGALTQELARLGIIG